MNTNPIGSLPLVLPVVTFTSRDPQSPAATTSTSTTQPSDASGISPAARFLNELSQLQQQNPDQFNQALNQIVDRLKQAAQGVSNNGNSQRADQLNQLATQFQNALNGGQLPTAQQLQQAGLTGQHHHGGHHHSGGHANLLNAIQTQSANSDSNNVLKGFFSPASPTQGS